VSRKEIDAFTAAAKAAGAGGLIWARKSDAGGEGQGVKALGATTLAAVAERGGPDDSGGSWDTTQHLTRIARRPQSADPEAGRRRDATACVRVGRRLSPL